MAEQPRPNNATEKLADIERLLRRILVIGVILATVFFADFALMVANRITIDQRYTIQEERNRQFEVRQAKSDAQMEDAQRNLVTARAWSQLPQPNPTKTK